MAVTRILSTTDPTPGQVAIRLAWYDGDRQALRPLFTEAEDSEQQLDAYINEGRVLVAWLGEHPVGHYQRCGFRLSTIERNAFTPEAGYPDQIVIDGIPLRDRVWLDRPVTGVAPTT